MSAAVLNMPQIYRGSCHCRRVTFEVRASLEYVIDCNCSLCRRRGALWRDATEADLRILTGEADLVLYEFNTRTAKHYFCGHCGIHPFIRPRLDPSRWAVNVRCLDGVDLSSIEVRKFDGENWEEAAKSFLRPASRPDVELVIFDCDGVLIDSEPIANRVLAERLAAVGVELSADEVMSRFVGKTRTGCLELAARLLGHALPEDFAAGWDAALFEALDREVRPIEGIPQLIAGLRVPFCVASNSSRNRMRVSLGAAGLLAAFEARMFSAEDVEHPKPAPDLFLHAAHMMGATPQRCMVIEDTPTGVRAAVAAGMRVLGYAAGAHSDPAALKAAGAKVFSDMRALTVLLAA